MRCNGISESFCFLSNLSWFLNFYGIKIEEQQLGIMIGYVGFLFSEEQFYTEEGILGRNESFEEMFLQAEKVFGEENFIITEYTDKNIVKVNQHLGRLALLWIDEYYLPQSYYFEKFHFRGIVCAEIVDEKYIHIYDREVKKMALQDWMDVLKKQKRIKVVCWNERERQVEIPIEHLMKKGIERVPHNMLLHEGSSIKGITGLYSFRNFVKCCKEKEKLESISYQLRRACSPTYTRKNLAQALEAVCRNREVIDLYDQLSEEWDVLAGMIYKYCIVETSGIKERILQRIERIIEFEVKGVILILSIFE